MRDFFAARRAEVPQYGAYELMRQRNQLAINDQKRQATQDKLGNLETIYGGFSDAMGPDKSPISEALRMGKEGWGKMTSGGPPPTQPPRTIPQEPSGGGLRSAAGPGGPGKHQLTQALRSKPAPAPAAPAPPPTKPPINTPAKAPPPNFLKGTGINMDNILKGGTPNLSPGPGPQAAVGGPSAANMTAQVGGGGGGGAAKAASGMAAKAPIIGAVTGALPGAIQGDTQAAAKGAISGGASSALMSAAPAMAAAGPVGWAGIAGLAALSLYGMLS